MLTLKPRNPFAHAPQMKKGGAHQRSASGARFGNKQALLAELDDWYEEYRDASATEHTTEADDSDKPGCAPVFLRPRPLAGHHARH